MGGYFSFFGGFRMGTWLATFIMIFTIPACLHLVYFVLKYYQLSESTEWQYVWNLFVVFGALAQQVEFQINFESIVCILKVTIGPV